MAETQPGHAVRALLEPWQANRFLPRCAWFHGWICRTLNGRTHFISMLMTWMGITRAPIRQ